MDNMDMNSIQELNRLQQLEQMKKALLGKVLTKEAYERLSRVRIANPQLAAQVEVYFLQIHQAGKLQGSKINDDKLKQVLKTLTIESRDFNIRRK